MRNPFIWWVTLKLISIGDDRLCVILIAIGWWRFIHQLALMIYPIKKQSKSDTIKTHSTIGGLLDVSTISVSPWLSSLISLCPTVSSHHQVTMRVLDWRLRKLKLQPSMLWAICRVLEVFMDKNAFWYGQTNISGLMSKLWPLELKYLEPPRLPNCVSNYFVLGHGCFLTTVWYSRILTMCRYGTQTVMQIRVVLSENGWDRCLVRYLSSYWEL